VDDSGDARADLHAHTIASDGTFTPEELAEEAQWKGLSAVAITDHDAVDGVESCQRRGKALGVEIVPGVELSSHEGNGDIHVIGLFIDPTHGLLMECLAELRQEREERVARIVTKLNGLGVAVDERDVYDVAGSAPPGRVHVAEALRRRGAVQSLNAAFDRYIGDNGPAYVARKLLTPERAIDIVHAAGGVAVFAHPGLTQKDHRIPDLAEHGLDGLEVRCLHHGPSLEAQYRSMARRLGLLPSGGSDFHGARNASVSLGAVAVPMSHVDDLRAAARRVRANAATT